MNKHVVVLITCPSTKEARHIADELVATRLAACVTLVDPVHSIFHWQETIENAEESLLVVKTKTELLAKLTSMVKRFHSYELAEIIALPIVGGSQDYLNWIDAETIS